MVSDTLRNVVTRLESRKIVGILNNAANLLVKKLGPGWNKFLPDLV
jgi:hypothetical protein